MQRRKIRILVIDDDLAMLSLYEEYLGNRLGYRVDRASIAGEAARMASETMYDIAICDAKLNYKRSSFGGLLLAEEFARRFGCNAVLVVSRIVDEDHVRLFEVMPFGNDHVDVMFEDGLRKGAMRAGFRIVRIDQVKFGESILAKTRQMIADAHFVVLMTAGGNANAFYEAGFAHALGKRLVVCAPEVADVPFNVREFQCILYQDAPVQLHRKLCEMLTGMRHQ